MAKKKKKATKKKAKPGKPTSGKSGGTKPKKDDESLPKAKAKPAQIDTLVTLVRRLVRKVAKVHQSQAQDRRLQESAPSTPAPWEAAFATVVTELAETRRQLDRIESRQQQPPRDPSLDVPLSVLEKRVFVAGACKTLNLIRPTPAIVGRAMHAEKTTSREVAKSPYEIFNAIYTAVKIAMGFQSSGSEESPNVARDFIHLDADMVALMEDRSTRPKKKHASYCDDQLSPRLRLLENMQLARVETNRSGRRVNYSRYLKPEGQLLFNGWPEWTDATGGIGLVDEEATPAPPPPSEPSSAAPSPDAGVDPTPPPT